MCRKQYKINYGVQPKCSIFNKSDHNTNQLSTKVITIRIDFNLYFDNIRHICVSIYIHEGLIYSTQRLDERTQSYMRPNVVYVKMWFLQAPFVQCGSMTLHDASHRAETQQCVIHDYTCSGIQHTFSRQRLKLSSKWAENSQSSCWWF